MSIGLSHIALLVPSVESAAKVLHSHDIAVGEPETFEQEGTKEVYVGSYEERSCLLLLVEAIAEGPYRRALDKRGPSLHHIAIDVLDLKNFSKEAQNLGWDLHPISSETLKHKTAWYYQKGVPCLLEVHETDHISRLPQKVSRLELALKNEHLSLFHGIGLGDFVFKGDKTVLNIDGQQLEFEQIAGIN